MPTSNHGVKQFTLTSTVRLLNDLREANFHVPKNGHVEIHLRDDQPAGFRYSGVLMNRKDIERIETLEAIP